MNALVVTAAFLIFGVTSFCMAVEPPAPEIAKFIEGARGEKRIVIYHAPVVPDIKMILDRFTQKYPFMSGEQYRASSVSLVNRVMAEARAKVNKWDVIINNSLFLQQLKKDDVLLKYPPAERSAYGKGFRDEDGYWNGIFINTHVVCYNTRLVAPKDVPRSYMDLLDPKWAGRIAIESEPYEWVAGIEKVWGRQKAWDYLRQLSKQKVIIRQGRSLLTQLCSAGEFALTLPVYGYDVDRKKREGAPLDWLPLDPVIVNQLGIAVAKTPPSPNAARLFVEFALSREGQSVVREFGRIPARLEIQPDPPRLTQDIHLIPTDPNLGAEVSRVLKEFNSVFK